MAYLHCLLPFLIYKPMLFLGRIGRNIGRHVLANVVCNPILIAHLKTHIQSGLQLCYI